MLVLSHFTNFGSGPIVAPTVFSVGFFNVTNAMLMGIVIAALIAITFVIAAHKSKVMPKSKFAFFIENVLTFVLDSVKGNFDGDANKARKFLPLFLTLFVFIILNNLFGLLPGIGGSIYIENNGVKEALLRPFTTDLNGTLALAFISISVVQFYAIRERGFFGHIKHYFSVTTPWWNPMNFFLGPIEILGEFIRLLTLAMRLFGVIYAGEVLLGVIAELSGNFAWIGTVPVILLEIFFSCIQAYLFIMLSSVYLAMGTTNHSDDHKNDEESVASPTLSLKDSAGTSK